MLNKSKYKTRLTQKKKEKHTSNAYLKEEREKEKSQYHLDPLSFHILEEPFRLANP